MSNPTNHHWLPQFLTRRWCGDDNLVNRFYRPHTKVVAGRKSIKSLGAIENLYTVDWSGAKDPFYLEKEFFTRGIDTPSSLIVEKMLSGGVDNLTVLEKKTFAQFLLMQTVRVKERFEGEDPDIFPNLGWFMQAARRDDSPLKEASEENLREIFRNHIQGFSKHMRVTAMGEFSVDQHMVYMITNLKWYILDNKNGRVDFVIGDSPIRLMGRNGSLDRVSIPLSPSHMFFAATQEYIDHEIVLHDNYREIFVIEENRYQFQAADDFVISRDLGPNDGFLKIAEMYMKPKQPQKPRNE